MSRATHRPDQTKLPIIVRIGLCGHRRRKRGGAQALAAARRASLRKVERRTARRSGL
jgi:hypothetical protein